MAGNWFVIRNRSSTAEDECRRALASILNLCQKLQLWSWRSRSGEGNEPGPHAAQLK